MVLVFKGRQGRKRGLMNGASPSSTIDKTDAGLVFIEELSERALSSNFPTNRQNCDALRHLVQQ
jgi:hypothetical protein